MDDNAWIRKIATPEDLLCCGDPRVWLAMQRRIKERIRRTWKRIENLQAEILLTKSFRRSMDAEWEIRELKEDVMVYESYLNDSSLNEQVDYILRLIDLLPERQQRVIAERMGIQVGSPFDREKQPSTQRVQLRLTVFEHNQLKAISHATGFTTSQLLRQCLLETTEQTDIQWELRRNRPKSKLEEKVWARLPIQLLERAKKLAQSNRVATSTFIRAALRHYIEKQRNPPPRPITFL